MELPREWCEALVGAAWERGRIYTGAYEKHHNGPQNHHKIDHKTTTTDHNTTHKITPSGGGRRADGPRG